MGRILSPLPLSLCFLLTAGAMSAQQKPAPTQPPRPPASLISPEVHADGSVSFRFRAPNALEVKLAREGTEPVSMQRDERGVWSVATPPLAPDYYGYSFIADGVGLIDSENALLIRKLMPPGMSAHVPGPSSLSWVLDDVPVSEINCPLYTSKLAECFHYY